MSGIGARGRHGSMVIDQSCFDIGHHTHEGSCGELVGATSRDRSSMAPEDAARLCISLPQKHSSERRGHADNEKFVTTSYKSDLPEMLAGELQQDKVRSQSASVLRSPVSIAANIRNYISGQRKSKDSQSAPLSPCGMTLNEPRLVETSPEDSHAIAKDDVSNSSQFFATKLLKRMRSPTSTSAGAKTAKTAGKMSILSFLNRKSASKASEEQPSGTRASVPLAIDVNAGFGSVQASASSNITFGLNAPIGAIGTGLNKRVANRVKSQEDEWTELARWSGVAKKPVEVLNAELMLLFTAAKSKGAVVETNPNAEKVE